MKTVSLSRIEVILLEEILSNYSDELDPMLGQDLTGFLDDELSSVYRDSRELEAFGDDIVICSDGSYNLPTAIEYFLNKLRSAKG